MAIPQPQFNAPNSLPKARFENTQRKGGAKGVSSIARIVLFGLGSFVLFYFASNLIMELERAYLRWTEWPLLIATIVLSVIMVGGWSAAQVFQRRHEHHLAHCFQGIAAGALLLTLGNVVAFSFPFVQGYLTNKAILEVKCAEDVDFAVVHVKRQSDLVATIDTRSESSAFVPEGDYRLEIASASWNTPDELSEEWEYFYDYSINVSPSSRFFHKGRRHRVFVQRTSVKRRRGDVLAFAEMLPGVDGWIPLFNGADLTGWNAIPPQSWRVENGAIHGSGPDGFLVTKTGDFDNFHLRAEFRINAEGDSGIHFRIPTPQPKRTTRWGYSISGMEAEIGIQKSPGYRTGALTLKDGEVRELAVAKAPPHAAGEWVTLEIKAEGDRIQILVNGNLANEYIDRERKYRKGHLALASWEHENRTNVEFRKVEIRKLPAAANSLAGQVLAGSSADVLTSPEWLWTTPENLGPLVNTSATEGGPTLSSDGLTLVFHSNRDGGYGEFDLWSSSRSTPDAPWGPPINLGGDVNSALPALNPCLSSDSRMLIFEVIDEKSAGDVDLWISTRDSPTGRWTKPVLIPGPVNSTASIGGPALSSDGLTLIFHSDREGNDDIWESTRSSLTGTWSHPKKMGKPISSSAFQGWATLSSDSLALLFNSNRLGGAPAGPLWISTRTRVTGAWSEPVRLWSDRKGAWSPCLSADNTLMLFDSRRPGGQGEFDIWMSRRVRKAVTPEAWTQLFNGQNLTGWKAQPDGDASWKVERGVLVGEGGPTFLATERGDFRDFHLRAEARIDATSDSGVYFRCQPDPSHPRRVRHGYEAQIISPAPLPSRTGSLSKFVDGETRDIKLLDQNLIQADTWFVLEVIAVGNQITVKVDGNVAVSYVDERDPPRAGHIGLDLYKEGSRVEFRKIEIKELSAAVQAAQAQNPVATLWGKEKDDWQAGVGWKGGQLRFAADEPVEFELKVRNMTDAEKAIEIDKPDGWDLWYSGGDELQVRIFGGKKEKLTLAPKEEKTIEVPGAQIKTEGINKGFYAVRFSTPFDGKDRDLADPEFGFFLEREDPQPFARPAVRTEPLKHPDDKYANVAWGEPVLGLSFGWQPVESEEAYSAIEFFLWNTSATAVQVEYLEHHALDWQILLRDKDGKEIRSEPILTGPKVDANKRLAAGAVVSLGVTTVDQLWSASGRSRYDLPAGSYKASSWFNCQRTDYGHLNLRLTSGEATMEIKNP